jgi:light-regulated signal transduction histidine kinase (bacteriophytochrome)
MPEPAGEAPILNIEGLLKALERQLGEQQRQKDTVATIYGLLFGSVDRFKTTIRDLTEVARIAKESAQDVISVDLGEIFEEVQKDLQPQIQEVDAELDAALDGPQICFSRKNLKSILYNLLSNALKYRSPNRRPKVQISCQQEENYLVLTVQDNGLGMYVRQEEKTFALFKRSHSHVEGKGIGLYRGRHNLTEMECSAALQEWLNR